MPTLTAIAECVLQTFLANYSLSVETFVEYSNREVEALNAMDVTEF